jgi:hypothetical protein
MIPFNCTQAITYVGGLVNVLEINCQNLLMCDIYQHFCQGITQLFDFFDTSHTIFIH